jgi:glycosyltransferase involved in cell wall biosynthesis
MKVLLIHNKYGKFSGEEAVVESQIKLLKDRGHQVITYFRSSEELATIPNGKMKAFFAAFYNPKSIKKLTILIEKEQPDIVHVHNLYPLISPAILAHIKKMGVPIAMTVHNYRLLCPNGLFFNDGKICEKCTGKGKELNCLTNNCEDSLFKSAGYALRNFWARKNKYYIDNVDAFLCLTEFQKRKLVSNGYPENKFQIIPNFYDKTIKDVVYDPKQKNYVAFAGRISPEKGIPILLEAAKQLPHIQFQLAGEMREDYHKELTIPENVTLRGMLSQKSMKDFYQKASIYIHSSECYEGFPMVFPEAMAHKLPIIAPNLAGFPEIIESNINGLLFQPGDAKILANKIEMLWNNSKLSQKLAENNFKKVKTTYSSDNYYNKLIIAYKNILKNE